MDGTRKYPELGNPNTKEYTWYVISPETQNTQDTTHRPQKTQVGSPNFGFSEKGNKIVTGTIRQ